MGSSSSTYTATAIVFATRQLDATIESILGTPPEKEACCIDECSDRGLSPPLLAIVGRPASLGRGFCMVNLTVVLKRFPLLCLGDADGGDAAGSTDDDATVRWS